MDKKKLKSKAQTVFPWPPLVLKTLLTSAVILLSYERQRPYLPAKNTAAVFLVPAIFNGIHLSVSFRIIKPKIPFIFSC